MKKTPSQEVDKTANILLWVAILASVIHLFIFSSGYLVAITIVAIPLFIIFEVTRLICEAIEYTKDGE